MQTLMGVSADREIEELSPAVTEGAGADERHHHQSVLAAR